MSKIQITELHFQTSELKTLNKAETGEVLGGYRSFVRNYSWKFNTYISSKFNGSLRGINRINLDFNGKKYSFTKKSTRNSKYSYILVD